MTTAALVVAKARSYIGVTEDPAGSNCNPFSSYLGRPCHYWCADFTAAVLRQCGAPIPPGADTASTRLNLAAWKKAGQWVGPHEIQPGDVAFFHISGRNGSNPNVPDHTGIAVQAAGGSFLATVEGNTSSGASGSQDNGGGVYARNRRLTVVIGAGRPAYATAPSQEDELASKLWRPVGQPGQPNVGGEFVQEGHLFVALSGVTKQQLANSEGGGDVTKLHVQDAEPELWKAITDDYKNVVT